MKCHTFLLLASLATLASADSKAPELPAEHRAAKPEPAFLDRLASALFGSSDKKSEKIGNSIGQHQPPKRVQKLPPYKRPLRPQPSYNAPVVATRPQVKPPQNGYGAPQAPVISRPQNRPPVLGQPPRRPQPPPPKQQPQSNPQQGIYKPAASNNFPSVFGGQSSGGFNSIGGGGSFDPWQSAQPVNMAQIKDLQVQCEKDLMRVRVEFDRPFYGMIFSKGHYSNVNCVHVPSGLGQTQATFDIALRSCGMSSSVNDGYSSPTPQGSFIENTIIVQYDPLLQEVWDQARKLRCTWYDFYEKAVTFKPYQVDMLDPVTANFLGDNLRCWMQIQVGKGPHASEVSGIVKIGQTMTMVLGVKDDENKFDMMVRNCVAHDGQRSPIQLVDEKGCVVRPKIMSPFKKLKNFDTTANVLSYAYFQAFKFPDSMNVHFQCVVQVCRGACPDPQCPGQSGGGSSSSYSSSPSAGNAYSASSTSSLSAGNSYSSVPSSNGYGAPQAPAQDSYGSPLGRPLGNTAISPRLPLGGQTTYQASGSEQKVTVVKPDGTEVTDLRAKEEEPDRLSLTEPGYENDFQSRLGHLSAGSAVRQGPLDLGGGRPRSLDLDEGSEKKKRLPRPQPLRSAGGDDNSINVKANEGVRNAVDSAVGEDQEVKTSRSRRSMSPAYDANGNRILRVVRREAKDMADLETEKVIQVLAPNDVQFELNPNESNQEEVVINSKADPLLSSEAVCIDTPAFVGVAISFVMILIIALITIVFLWLRIRSLDRKNLL